MTSFTEVIKLLITITIIIMVELNGTLSNREVLLETSDLAQLKVRLFQEFQEHTGVPVPPKQRAGLIKQTVIRVLQEAAGPLRGTEIRLACEERLGMPVNRSTVSDCLIKHSNGRLRLFDRDARGGYTRRNV